MLLKNVLNKRDKKNSVLTFLFVLFFIVTEPYTFFSMYQFNIFLKLIVLFFLSFLLCFKYKVDIRHINSNALLCVLLFTVYIVVSKVIHFDDSNYYFELIIQLLCAFCVIMYLNSDEFCINYIRVMRFLAIYSIVFTYLILFLPRIRTFFPTFLHSSTIYYNGSITFINGFLCNVYIPDYELQYRNFGIFREPGLYAIYLIYAFILDINIKGKQHEKMVGSLIIWNIAIVSTFSPIAIVMTFLTDMYYLLFFRNETKVSNKIYFIIVGFIIFVFLLRFSFFQTNIMQGFNKFTGGDSFTSRLYSFVGAAKAWIYSPFIGWGYSGMVSGEGSQYIRQYTNDYTNTSMLIFSIFGLLFGIAYHYGLYRFWKKYSITIIGIIIILITLSTQELIRSSLLFAFIIYGYITIKPRNSISMLASS